jgi:hypothetical protein
MVDFTMAIIMSILRHATSLTTTARKRLFITRSRKCYLLQLLPELLELIIQQVVSSHEGRPDRFIHAAIRGPRPRVRLCGNVRGPLLGYRFRGPAIPPLANTCRQLRNDGVKIFYRERPWVFDLGGCDGSRAHTSGLRHNDWWLSAPSFTIAAPHLRDISLEMSCKTYTERIRTGWPEHLWISLVQVSNRIQLELRQHTESVCLCALSDTVDAMNAGGTMAGTMEGDSKAAGFMRWLFTYDKALETPSYEHEYQACARCGKDGIFVF